MSSSTPGQNVAPKRRFSILNVLLIVVPSCLIVGGAAGWYYHESMKAAGGPLNLGKLLRSSFEVPVQLDSRFTDSDGDLVADPPTESAKLFDPPELVFSVLGIDEEREKKTWADFLKHLKEKTGKDVQLTLGSYTNREQFAALTEGKTHVLQLSTGQVPIAVNVGGFVPVCVMADEQGQFGYQMEMITPAGGPVKSLQDLRGRTIALMNFRSNSGFKLPVTVLWSQLGMFPEHDYQWRYSYPELAMKWVKEGSIDAAPIPSDLLSREIAKPEGERAIGPNDYRIVYTSDKKFPPACFGHVHNLNPDLAAKVREAFLSFEWKGTSLESAYKAANQSKFVPINYKENWAAVREVDEQIMKFSEAKR